VTKICYMQHQSFLGVSNSAVFTSVLLGCMLRRQDAVDCRGQDRLGAYIWIAIVQGFQKDFVAFVTMKLERLNVHIIRLVSDGFLPRGRTLQRRWKMLST
jgi:hypothetical protein